MGRRLLLDPVPAIFDAAALLSEAVAAHLAGNRERADALLRQADVPAIAEWTERLWGKSSVGAAIFRAVPGAPETVPKAARAAPRDPGADVRRAVIQRDGHHCRFCGAPVVERHIRRAIRTAYPQALRWGAANAEQHAAFQCMSLQFDHILPHSRGGPTSVDNLVVTCAPCNFGRGDWTLEEVGLLDPRTLPVEPCSWPGYESWDGLRRFVRREAGAGCETGR